MLRGDGKFVLDRNVGMCADVLGDSVHDHVHQFVVCGFDTLMRQQWLRYGR